MKKIIALVACSLFLSVSAYADDNLGIGTDFGNAGKTINGAKSGTPGTTAPLIGKLSTGVAISAKTATTGYAVITQHKNGIKAYGSAFDSTSIYQATTTAGTAVNSGNAPSSANSAIFVTGSTWTTM